MSRIIIIGCPGGGKTTFANKLGQKLKIPVHHLDRIFWKENWTPTPQDEFRKTVIDLMKEDRWILDGNFKRSIADRIALADTVILFDFPKSVILWRVLKRFFQHFNRVRPDMGGDNKESLQWAHIKYIITYRRKAYREQIIKQTIGKKLVILGNPTDASSFLKEL